MLTSEWWYKIHTHFKLEYFKLWNSSTSDDASFLVHSIWDHLRFFYYWSSLFDIIIDKFGSWGPLYTETNKPNKTNKPKQTRIPTKTIEGKDTYKPTDQTTVKSIVVAMLKCMTPKIATVTR